MGNPINVIVSLQCYIRKKMEGSYCKVKEVVDTPAEEEELNYEQTLIHTHDIALLLYYFVKLSANEIIALFSITLCPVELLY